MLEDYLYERKLANIMVAKQSTHFTEEEGKKHEWKKVEAEPAGEEAL